MRSPRVVVLAGTVALCVTGCAETASAPQANYHVVLQVNGSDGIKWIEWSASKEPPGSVVGPLTPWTFEYQWTMNSSRRVRVTANNAGDWVRCSISVNDVQKIAQRDDTPYGGVTCDIKVG